MNKVNALFYFGTVSVSIIELPIVFLFEMIARTWTSATISTTNTDDLLSLQNFD